MTLTGSVTQAQTGEYVQMIVSSSHPQKKVHLPDELDIFSHSGWLSRRSDAVRRLILPLGRPRSYDAGETLYRVGDMPDGIYGLLRGRVSLSTPNDIGSVFDCHIAYPGFWIGDLALLAQSPRLITITAQSPVDVWFLPQASLVDLLRPHPELLTDFYALNHENTAVALRLLANLSIPDTTRRVAAWLLFSDESLSDTDGWILCSQEQIGMMNAISLPTTRRILKKLADQGLIELGYGRLRVGDRGRMSEFCAT